MKLTTVKIKFIMDMLHVFSILTLFGPADRAMARSIYEDFKNAVDANGGLEKMKETIG